MNTKRLFTLISLIVLAITLLPVQPAHASTYTVTNTNDSGDGSLRWAITQANSNPGTDTITFNIPGAGVHAITPTSVLPTLTDDGTTIDGYTQPGAAPANATTQATILIEIDGTSTTNQNGLNIASANNLIRGLAINRFDLIGIAIGLDTAHGNVIAGNYLGTDAGGAIARGNGTDGVYIALGTTNNTIGGNEPAERNLLSGNGWEGVGIHGSATTSNTVSGNYIGTNAAGTAAIANTLYGVRIYGGSHHNTIGGNSTGSENLISGNNQDGVRIAGDSTHDNTVIRNYIGTNASGTASLGNLENGIYLGLGTYANVIGGITPAERNLISGNGQDGVSIHDSNTVSNTIRGNYIGTNAAGTAALANSSGIYCDGVANTIGGTAPGEGNLISGNTYSGVFLIGPYTSQNTIVGNQIGTNASGTIGLGNGSDGVAIWQEASGNTVGPGNVISGNTGDGISLGVNVTGTHIIGNYIGTDLSGMADLGNSGNGILVDWAHSNTIGGSTPAERNIISGNDQVGIEINGMESTANVVIGNYIGINAAGTARLGNFYHGIVIENAAHDNTIGGLAAGEGNIITGNGNYGVGIWDEGSDNNLLLGNFIGTDPAGTQGLGNGFFGVLIAYDAQDNWIAGGIIAYHTASGVSISGATTTGNVVSQVSLFANGNRGIGLESGGNGNVASPVITAALPGITILGTALPGSIVEIFASPDYDEEGKVYLGQAVTDPSGNFTLTVTALPHPYLTATARDATLGTSQFSAVFVSTVQFIYLPLVMR